MNTFCELNDVVLNKKKLSRYLPSKNHSVRDRAYSAQEIHKLLQVCDLRFKVLVYILCSTGIRIGALPSLKLKHLKKIKDHGIYEFTIYEKSNEEYVTFCTTECAEAIDTYLEYRTRAGEELNEESPLLREQFDVTNPLKVAYPKKITITNIYNILGDNARRAGLRILDKENGPRSRHPIKLCHGFRKFFTTVCINAEINSDIRKMLEGHKNQMGIDWHYYRPHKDKMISEYLKVINDLTINEENRLRKEITYLKIRQDRLEKVMDDLEQVKKQLGLNF